MDNSRNQTIWNSTERAIRLGRIVDIAGSVYIVLAAISLGCAVAVGVFFRTDTLGWSLVGPAIGISFVLFVSGNVLSLYGVRGQLHGYESQDRILEEDMIDD